MVKNQGFRIGAFPRIALLFVLILTLGGCGSSSARSFDGPGAAADLGVTLDGFVRDQDGAINRNALLYIDAPHAGFTYTGAAGIGRVDTSEPMTPEHQFIVASVGKATTAVVIHQMAEEGAFGAEGVDARLADLDVLPPEVIDALHRIDGMSYGREITLRHLLNHTSGLRDAYFDGVDNRVGLMPGTADGAAPDSLVGMAAFDEQYGLTPLVNCTMKGDPPGCDPDDYLFRHKWAAWDYEAWQADPADRMAGLLNFYLAGMNEHALWEPGEGFHYADTNYILLGIVIESLTGNSLHHELRARIFDPLGMDDTYLLGAADPPAENYERNLAEVWAWGEPSISGGVDFSFDWGGGGVVSTLADLNTFMRALVAGDLFEQPGTLDDYLAVPEGVRGLHYASGLIVFPTAEGPVLYMMGSNGTWVEYYPPEDLVMIGTVDDFSNVPGQVRLHIQLYGVLAQHGLSTPMATFTSAPMTVFQISVILLILLSLILLIAALFRRRGGEPPAASVRWMRRLTAAGLAAVLVLMVMIGLSLGEDSFQMMFDFSPEVRTLFGVAAAVMGLFGIAMAVFAGRKWVRKEGRPFDRGLAAAVAILMLVCAVSIGALA
jgi:D-alanyl-D-alanine carboxypeptidase